MLGQWFVSRHQSQFWDKNLSVAVGARAYDKSCLVKPGRVVEVVTVGHALGISGGPQTFGGLVAGVVLDSLLVGAGVMGGAVEAEGQIMLVNTKGYTDDICDFIFYSALKNEAATLPSQEIQKLMRPGIPSHLQAKSGD